MSIIELEPDEVVYEIRVIIAQHISVTYYNRETRTMRRPDLHPYTREGFAEVKAYGDKHLFLMTGTKSDWVWSYVPF